MGHSSLAVTMKCFALFALASVALARPADDAAAVAPLVYGLPYGALAAPGYALPYAAPHVAYAHAPVVYNALQPDEDDNTGGRGRPNDNRGGNPENRRRFQTQAAAGPSGARPNQGPPQGLPFNLPEGAQILARPPQQ